MTFIYAAGHGRLQKGHMSNSLFYSMMIESIFYYAVFLVSSSMKAFMTSINFNKKLASPLAAYFIKQNRHTLPIAHFLDDVETKF